MDSHDQELEQDILEYITDIREPVSLMEIEASFANRIGDDRKGGVREALQNLEIQQKCCSHEYTLENGELVLYWVNYDDCYKTESLESLKSRISYLDDKISELNDLKKRSLKNQYIQRLHKYNELKDLGQVLIGQLALIEQSTTKYQYKKFGIELDD